MAHEFFQPEGKFLDWDEGTSSTIARDFLASWSEEAVQAPADDLSLAGRQLMRALDVLKAVTPPHRHSVVLLAEILAFYGGADELIEALRDARARIEHHSKKAYGLDDQEPKPARRRRQQSNSRSAG